MPNGKVYDPLVGQWMSPQWEGMLTRATEPQQLHLYRFNGNDPINVIPSRQYLKGKSCSSQKWFYLFLREQCYFTFYLN